MIVLASCVGKKVTLCEVQLANRACRQSEEELGQEVKKLNHPTGQVPLLTNASPGFLHRCIFGRYDRLRVLAGRVRLGQLRREVITLHQKAVWIRLRRRGERVLRA